MRVGSPPNIRCGPVSTVSMSESCDMLRIRTSSAVSSAHKTPGEQVGYVGVPTDDPARLTHWRGY